MAYQLSIRRLIAHIWTLRFHRRSRSAKPPAAARRSGVSPLDFARSTSLVKRAFRSRRSSVSKIAGKAASRRSPESRTRYAPRTNSATSSRRTTRAHSTRSSRRTVLVAAPAFAGRQAHRLDNCHDDILGSSGGDSGAGAKHLSHGSLPRALGRSSSYRRRGSGALEGRNER